MVVLAPSLVRLRADYNAAFPRRRRDSDGWIGDRRHQLSPSAHNPDDTPGSRPESEDADSIAEVRGLDVDKDLLPPAGSQVTMQETLDRIIRTERDRRRLKYVIFKRRVVSANAGWFKANGDINWRPYSGDNTHDEHAHFSGNPLYDNDNAPWSVLDFLEEDVELNDRNPQSNYAGDPTISPPVLNVSVGESMGYGYQHAYYSRMIAAQNRTALIALTGKVDALTGVIQALADAVNEGGGNVDTAAILAGVDERLAALAAEQRDAVADLGEGGAAQVRADA